MFIKGVVLACLSLIASIEGHGALTKPAPRNTLIAGGTLAQFQQNEPSGKSENFVCRKTVAQTSKTAITAGQNLVLRWDFSANHVGDCFLYISYDTGKPDLEKQWAKIANLPQCNLQNGQDVNVLIPTHLPSGNAILRWEWYALHVYPGVEFYAQCVDVIVSGDNKWGVPQPTNLVPGHLPDGGGTAYRNPFNPSAPFFLTGPPIAAATLAGGGQPPTDDGPGGADDGKAGGDETMLQCNRYTGNPFSISGTIDAVTGKCDPTTDVRCDNNQCCSAAGFCGDTAEYCDAATSLGDWRVNDKCLTWDYEAYTDTCWCVDASSTSTGAEKDDAYKGPFVAVLLIMIGFAVATVFLIVRQRKNTAPGLRANML